MDMNTYALEILARDRLEQARAEAAVHRLLASHAARTPRVPLRVSLGRWLRGDEVQGELARG
jgi:hypothetical protein